MKKRFSGPQIVAKLRQADVLIGQGKAVPEVCKEIEISQQTYYRWHQSVHLQYLLMHATIQLGSNTALPRGHNPEMEWSDC